MRPRINNAPTRRIYPDLIASLSRKATTATAALALGLTPSASSPPAPLRPVATAAFAPRTTIALSDSLSRTYYLGHHESALRDIKRALIPAGLVLECRDARLPLTSVSPTLLAAVRATPRLVVYTHADLVPPRSLARLRRLDDGVPTLRGMGPLLWQGGGGGGGGGIMSAADLTRLLAGEQARADRLGAFNVLLVGPPNVGKSTLLNALRERHQAATGAENPKKGGGPSRVGNHPGVTRKVQGPVRVVGSKGRPDETVYVTDAPGIGYPFVPDPLDMVKLAACGLVKDGIFDHAILVDYLLFQMNLAGELVVESGGDDQGKRRRVCTGPAVYARYSPPTNDAAEFLANVARRTGRLAKGGEPNLEAAADWVVRRWRDGHFGRYLLDDIGDDALLERKRVEWRNPQRSARALMTAAKKAARERAGPQPAADQGLE